MLATVVLALPALTEAFELEAIGARELAIALGLAVVPFAVGEIVETRHRAGA